MNCLRCGNAIQLGENFCGQCGTQQTAPMPQIKMAPSPHMQSGPIPTVQPSSGPFSTSQAPASPSRSGSQGFRSLSSSSNRYPVPPATSRPEFQSGFSQDAPPFMTPRNAQGYQSDVRHPGLPGPMGSGATASHNRYSSPSPTQYSPPQPTSSQLRVSDVNHTANTPRSSQPHSTFIITICFFLVIALISVVGLLALNWYHTQQAQQHSATTDHVAALQQAETTTTPLSTATTTFSTTVTPSLTTTAVTERGFSWCDTSCSTFGFNAQYPDSWMLNPSPSKTELQVAHTNQAEIMALFKMPTPVGATTTTAELLQSEINTNYANRSGFSTQTQNLTTTISGKVWTTSILYYQGEIQKMRVEIYASIHNGKAYLIALQAPDGQFDRINSHTFLTIITTYRFL